MEDAISNMLRLALPEGWVKGGVFAICDWPKSSPALKDVRHVLDASAGGLCVYCSSSNHFAVHCPEKAPPNFLELATELAKVRTQLASCEKLLEEKDVAFKKVAAANAELRAQLAGVAAPIVAEIEAGIETAIAGAVEAAAEAAAAREGVEAASEDDGPDEGEDEEEESPVEIHADRADWLARDPKFPVAALRHFLEANGLVVTQEEEEYVCLREFAALSGAADVTERQHRPHRRRTRKKKGKGTSKGTTGDWRESTDNDRKRKFAYTWIEKVKARNPESELVDLTARGAGQVPPKGMAMADFMAIFAEPSSDVE